MAEPKTYTLLVTEVSPDEHGADTLCVAGDYEHMLAGHGVTVTSNAGDRLLLVISAAYEKADKRTRAKFPVGAFENDTPLSVTVTTTHKPRSFWHRFKHRIRAAKIALTPTPTPTPAT